MISPDNDESRSGAAVHGETSPAATTPLEMLASVYRNFPGLRALIVRRVRDPEAAADILQDAAVTTLEKLRAGEIANPGNIGGYLYRVALNHLRNHVRKANRGRTDSVTFEDVAGSDHEPEWRAVGHPQWAAAARILLDELPTARDRQLLVRFYLHDEDKSDICRDLQLSDVHFNRVVYRARARFRELLEHRGFRRADLLSLVALASCFAVGAASVAQLPSSVTLFSTLSSVAAGSIQ